MESFISPENMAAIKSITDFLNNPVVSYYLQAIGAFVNTLGISYLGWKATKVAARVTMGSCRLCGNVAGASYRYLRPVKKVDPYLANIIYCLEDPELQVEEGGKGSSPSASVETLKTCRGLVARIEFSSSTRDEPHLRGEETRLVLDDGGDCYCDLTPKEQAKVLAKLYKARCDALERDRIRRREVKANKLSPPKPGEYDLSSEDELSEPGAVNDGKHPCGCSYAYEGPCLNSSERSNSSWQKHG